MKTAATPVAAKAVTELAGRIASSLSRALTKPLREIALNLTANFGPHLAITYDRCTKLKTLVNPMEPVNLLDQYVNLKFKCGEKTFDDYAIIDEIRARKRVVISGTGGGGKTIFTKYIWISLFENPQGQIPVFVELRRLNELSSDDLLSFIYHSIVASHSNVPRSAFDSGVASGLFAFILDGFDEVAKEKKASLERQILELGKNNPDCIIVVSGRPDDVFAAWQSFFNFQVLPLSKKQAIELVNKLKFDKGTKKKFIARLNSDLYEKHRSFLSTPLLATLMLLTFNQFADIPEKIHLFYEQAFDTLFARHDALKEAFKRDMHSNLSIDVFKKYFSYFCLVSYYDEKIEFTDAEIKKYIARGLKIENAKVNKDLFLRDLQESVCVIQRDGLNLVFTHRTFQEFFAAYCLSRLSKKHFRPIVEKIANRWSDNVMQMLYDMNNDLLETEYLLPAAQELLGAFDKETPPADFLYKYCENCTMRVVFSSDEYPRFMGDDGNVIRGALRQLFPKEYKSVSAKFPRYRRQDRAVLKPVGEALLKEKKQEALLASLTIEPSGECRARVQLPRDGTQLGSQVDAGWIHKTGFAAYAQDDMEFFRVVARRLSDKAAKRNTTLEKLFGIDD
ncbi:NACHT domain-containing protein [Bradyrhizobium japonicum]|uniref:NACHT domain-containing protein n=1 Tax=Bradyrhizobium japonicum TaxID=375 RepID=UPI001BA5C09B|nr:NACHT domain-containing protein [Bradyrhizobium japonicum]MBR0747177.1 NACHT domain-containing protein [Bradyrhizobium japonicum]